MQQKVKITIEEKQTRLGIHLCSGEFVAYPSGERVYLVAVRNGHTFLVSLENGEGFDLDAGKLYRVLNPIEFRFSERWA